MRFQRVFTDLLKAEMPAFEAEAATGKFDLKPHLADQWLGLRVNRAYASVLGEVEALRKQEEAAQQARKDRFGENVADVITNFGDDSGEPAGANQPGEGSIFGQGAVFELAKKQADKRKLGLLKGIPLAISTLTRSVRKTNQTNNQASRPNLRQTNFKHSSDISLAPLCLALYVSNLNLESMDKTKHVGWWKRL